MQNNELAEFEDKIKKMNETQLHTYLIVSKSINRIIASIGVIFLTIMLAFPHISVITIGAFLVFLLAKLGEGVSKTQEIVTNQLLKFRKD